MPQDRRTDLSDIIKAEVAAALKAGGAAAKATEGGAFDFKDIMTFLTEVNKLAALREKSMAGVAPRQDARAVAEVHKGGAPVGAALNKEAEGNVAVQPAVAGGMLPRSGEVPRPAPAGITAESIFESIVGGLDGVITMYGDVKLSEAKAKMTENREAVLMLIRQQLGAP